MKNARPTAVKASVLIGADSATSSVAGVGKLLDLAKIGAGSWPSARSECDVAALDDQVSA